MNINELMIKYNLKQQETAVFLGLPRSTVANWAANKSKNRPERELRLADIADKFLSDFAPHEVKNAVHTHKIVANQIVQLSKLSNLSIVEEKVADYKLSNSLTSNKIPFYDVDILAGFGYLYDDRVTDKPMMMLDVPMFAGCKAFPVFSNSMSPLIESGNTIFCRQINTWQEWLEFGEVYAIQFLDGRRMLKKIRKHPKQPTDYFLLQSENKEEYDDIEVPKKMISGVWLVEGWMRRKVQ